MEFKHEEKNTPTFRQWAKSAEIASSRGFDIIRILCNSEWRAITFVTDEFRITRKISTAQEFDATVKKLGKTVTQFCRARITVHDKERADISLLPASDADENAKQFESDDFGFVRK
jgi:hypothetical protein